MAMFNSHVSLPEGTINLKSTRNVGSFTENI
jgi:hypothetical protein